ncbi:MAG: DUF4169 family protein [Flavimaricola sp.]|nr:DUF4169 family protein [Flavimaricola sp.]
MNATPINLNKVRKERDKAAEKARADANAVRHGLTKAQRLLNATKMEQVKRRIDQLKFDDE